MKTNILFASLASLIAFAPVAASAEPLINKPAAEATPSASSADATKAKQPTKYCFDIEAPTGSRIQRSDCRTQEEWNRVNVKVPSRFIR